MNLSTHSGFQLMMAKCGFSDHEENHFRNVISTENSEFGRFERYWGAKLMIFFITSRYTATVHTLDPYISQEYGSNHIEQSYSKLNFR